MDYYTDIITFDESQAGVVSGSMLVSLERVRSNAKAYGETYTSELLRVMIHGVLHMTGADDKTAAQARSMRDLESSALMVWQDMRGGDKGKASTAKGKRRER